MRIVVTLLQYILVTLTYALAILVSWLADWIGYPSYLL